MLYFLDNLSVAILIPFLSLYYSKNLNLPTSSREIISGIYSASQISGSLLISRYADNAVALRRRFLLLSFFGSGVSYLLLYFALLFCSKSNLTLATVLVCLSRVIVGLVKQTGVITTTILTENTPPSAKKETLANLNSVMTVAWILGPSVGSLLYDKVAHTAPVVVSCATFGVIFGIAVFFVEVSDVGAAVGAAAKTADDDHATNDLASLTVKQLRAMCDAEGVECKHLRLKADIIAALSAERPPPPPSPSSATPQDTSTNASTASSSSSSFSLQSLLPSLPPLLLSLGNRVAAPISPAATTSRYSLSETYLGYVSSYMSILHLGSLTVLLPWLPLEKVVPARMLPAVGCVALACVYALDAAIYTASPQDSPLPYLVVLLPSTTAVYLIAKINASSASLSATTNPATVLAMLDFGQNLIGILVPVLRVFLLNVIGGLNDDDVQTERWVYVQSGFWGAVGVVLLGVAAALQQQQQLAGGQEKEEEKKERTNKRKKDE
jgi:hypothetical protein